ncbi:MAG: hypothetical protein NT056_04990 [Proteobacteria bacterium]|nr:hypothetical protein [Pseudomonadota bacterium]
MNQTTVLNSKPYALCPLRPTSQRGQAMAEILVALPVLILIFAAVLYLGEGYNRKADTIIATRYTVWTNSRAGKSQVTEKDLALLFYNREEMKERLKLKNAPESEPFEDILLFGLTDLLGHGSGTDGKTLTLTFRPRPGSDKNTLISSTHYLDGNTWRDDREPGNALRFVSWGIAAARSNSNQNGSSGNQDFGDLGGAKVGKP